MTVAAVYTGALAPERLEVVISNAELDPSPLDLSTVTAADMDVTTPAERFTWPLTITSQSATEIVGYYAFGAGDTDTPGRYRIRVRLTIPGGVRRAGPTVLDVRE